VTADLRQSNAIWPHGFSLVSPPAREFSVRPKGEINVAMGTVKWFKPIKGYGFITPDDRGPDVFVHVGAVRRAGSKGRGARWLYENADASKKGRSAGLSKESAGEALNLMRRPVQRGDRNATTSACVGWEPPAIFRPRSSPCGRGAGPKQ
jgi:CspA family cold shock protein